MKKYLFLITLLTLLGGSFVPTAHAIGIISYSQGGLVSEGEQVCAKFGLFNSRSEDSTVSIQVEGKIRELLDSESLREILVASNTPQEAAIPADVCFNTQENVYPKDCILGVLCKTECPSEKVSYPGSISIVTLGNVAGSGSAASLSQLFPYTVAVDCKPHGRDYTAIIIVIVALIAGGIIWYYLKKYHPSKSIHQENV